MRRRCSALRKFTSRPILRYCFTLLLVPALGQKVAQAQDTTAEDDVINAIRGLGQIGESDQRRIGDWVQARVDALAKTPAAERQAAAIRFRSRFREQLENPGNSAAFKQQFPAQAAVVAASQFAKANLDPLVGRALARVLLDVDGPGATAAMLACLPSTDAATRYLCAQGLAAQRTAIAADKELFERTVKSVREAALSETSPAVLGRFYAVLSAPPNQVPAVFDAFMAIMDNRLQIRRSTAVFADGAEVDAYEYFRNPAVLGAMNPQQKEKLARTLAVFLRLDAARYNTEGLAFDEIDLLERMLDAEEEILAAIVGAGKGGAIREVLGQSGYERRADMLAQAYLWVGNPESSQQGALNAAPYNVPIGAP